MEIPKLKTGSFYLNDMHLTTKIPEIAFPENDIPDYVRTINLANPTSAEFELETEIDLPLMHRLRGMDLSDLSDWSSISVQYSEPYQEQRRKHKKKRINKKWAKRYGYVTKFRKWRINEVSLIPGGGFEFEASGKNIELVK